MKFLLLAIFFAIVFADYQVAYTVIPYDNVCSLDQDVTFKLEEHLENFSSFEDAKRQLEHDVNSDTDCKLVAADLYYKRHRLVSVYQPTDVCCRGEKEYMVVHVSGKLDTQKYLKI